MTQIRFALAQIDTCVGDLAGNAAKVLDYTRRAAGEHARVVVFPEMTLTGYPIEDLALRRTFRQAAWNQANELAAALAAEGLGELYVAVGTVGTDPETSKPRNRMVVLHEGVVWAGYDKHFLPNYGVFDEFRIFSAGDRSVVIDVDGARIGVAICEDIWQDGGPVAELAERGIDLLLTMNGSPYEEGKTHTRMELAIRRAREVGAPLIYLNQVGGQDDLIFDGGSFVVDSDGTLLERSPMFMEDLSYFTLDTDAARQTADQHRRRSGPGRGSLHGLRAGTEGLHAQERVQGRHARPVRRHRFGAGGRHGRGRLRRRNVWGISMPACTPPTARRTTPPTWPRTSAPTMTSSRSNRCSPRSRASWRWRAWPPRTCRRASAASS